MRSWGTGRRMDKPWIGQAAALGSPTIPSQARSPIPPGVGVAWFFGHSKRGPQGSSWGKAWRPWAERLWGGVGVGGDRQQVMVCTSCPVRIYVCSFSPPLGSPPRKLGDFPVILLMAAELWGHRRSKRPGSSPRPDPGPWDGPWPE